MNQISLLFHDVYLSDPNESGFSGSAAGIYKIDAKTFDRHLALLDEVLTTPPGLATESAKFTSKPPSVAITVDDGGVSYHSIVASRLEDRGWRGHCFVTTDYIGRRGFLAKHHLRDLHARGHVIGSHSASHRSHMGTSDAKTIYQEWSDSRKALEDILGVAVNCASVPGGYYAPRVAHAASEAGIKVLFTSEPDREIHAIESCLVFGRFTVRRGQQPEYVGRLAIGHPATLYKENLVWAGKKMLKALFRSTYPVVSEYVHGMRWDRNEGVGQVQSKRFQQVIASKEKKG